MLPITTRHYGYISTIKKGKASRYATLVYRFNYAIGKCRSNRATAKKKEIKFMIIEVRSIEFTKENVVIEAVNLETILTADDLFEEADEEIVRFVFGTGSENSTASRKYLYKVVQGNKKCAKEKSLGAKLQKLPGQIISLSESFIEK